MSKSIFFPYGTHIYREPSRPIDEIKNDLKVIKRLGFNMVKIQESWAIDERKEGEIDLSKIEEIIIEAEKLGLSVYFGFTMEQAPGWLWKKYPDAYLLYNDGTPHKDPTQYLLPSDGKPGPCWDHPGVRSEGERFIREVIKKLSVYENIIVWNVWQEVGLWPMHPGKLGFCYCPYTLEKFRNWLKGRYKTLNNLNEVWKTGYGNWDEVEPPRVHPFVPSWIDWRYYIKCVYLSEAIRWKYNAVKSNDPLKRPVFCHVSSPCIGDGTDWKFAEVVDFYGCSVYPAWGVKGMWDKQDYTDRGNKLFQIWNSISLKFDYIRSASMGKKFWAAEFQGGPIVSFLQRSKVPDKGDINRWVLTALSTGITGLCFWNHRAEIFWQEAYGFGLLDTEGETTVRAEEAGSIGKVINRYSEIFSEGKMEENEVGIFIDEDKFNFLEGTPIPGEGKATEHLIHTIRGIYKFLWGNGIWVDFLNKEYLHGIDRYKVIYLPFPISMDEESFERIKEYVKNGGVLISECCPGRYTKYGLARDQQIIGDEFFGVRHKEIIQIREKDRVLWSEKDPTFVEYHSSEYLKGSGIFEGLQIMPSFYIETYDIVDGKEILRYRDKVCGVMKNYGKGKVFLIGTFIGHSILTYEDRKTEKFLKKLVETIDIRENKIGKLLFRRKFYKDKELLFLINPTDKRVKEKIGTGYVDIFAGEGKTSDVSVEPLSVKILIRDLKTISKRSS